MRPPNGGRFVDNKPSTVSFFQVSCGHPPDCNTLLGSASDPPMDAPTTYGRLLGGRFVVGLGYPREPAGAGAAHNDAPLDGRVALRHRASDSVRPRPFVSRPAARPAGDRDAVAAKPGAGSCQVCGGIKGRGRTLVRRVRGEHLARRCAPMPPWVVCRHSGR